MTKRNVPFSKSAFPPLFDFLIVSQDFLPDTLAQYFYLSYAPELPGSSAGKESTGNEETPTPPPPPSSILGGEI